MSSTPHAGPTRRGLFGAAAALALAAPGIGRAGAQTAWRARRPIRVLVPFAPGGSTDILTRLITQKVGTGLGQPLVVENRPGGNGVVATQALLTAPADGHTLIMGTADTHTVLPFANPRLPYKLDEFVPVVGAAYTVFALAARSGLAATSVGELVTLAKRASPPLTYASYGIASTSHVAGEMFKSITGAEMVHVPYQGSGPAALAVAAGEADVGLIPIVPVHAQRERLRMLAVATQQRFDLVPELPTLTEAGVPLVADAWIGMLAAPRTPPEAAASVNRRFRGAGHARNAGTPCAPAGSPR